jgi:uncharacterized membrane protein YhaH (DUF805 family)
MNWQWLFASFEGRINRAKFWIGSLVLWVLWILVNGVLWTMFGVRYSEGELPSPVMGPVAWLVWVIIAIALTYATLAVWAKRWHDRDKSGWWSLIALVPIVGAIWILVELGCLPGTEGPNRFGPDPLAV